MEIKTFAVVGAAIRKKAQKKGIMPAPSVPAQKKGTTAPKTGTTKKVKGD